MEHVRELVANFAKCFRLIAKLSVTIDDDFFATLLNDESEKLLRVYLDFLKCEGGATNNVVPYNKNIILQIKNILGLLNIINHLNFSKQILRLILEKNLLRLESLVLDFKKRKIMTSSKHSVNRRVSVRNTHEKIVKELGGTHSELLTFINGKERVQNFEVFSKFSYITRRTLKRKLSELVSTGTIRRLSLGKKVFYQSVDPAPEKHLKF